MGKGGKKTTEERKIDPRLEAEALENIDITNAVSQLGFIPYQGNTMAAFTPQQVAGMQGIDQAAAAFGMPSAVNWQANEDRSGFTSPGMSEDDLYMALTGMPPPTTDSQGFRGYSPYGEYAAQLENIPQGQLDFIRSLFIDPETGEPATFFGDPAPAPAAPSRPLGGPAPFNPYAIDYLGGR